MNQSDILFIVCCVLIILIAITYSVMSVFIYKREQASKNPYYFCDATWKCCPTENCDATKSLSGPGISKQEYLYPSDNWKPGSAYHQNCVLPVQNAILNYNSTPNPTFNLDFIYLGGAKGANVPSLYYPGCAGPGTPGGTGDCNNPELNPQNSVDGSGTDVPCPYVSFDSGGSTGQSNGLFNGTKSYTGNNTTLNPSFWNSGGIPGSGGNKAAVYIAGTQSGSAAPGNSYSFPYTLKDSSVYKGQYTGGNGGTYNFTKSNTHLNTFYDLGNTNKPYNQSNAHTYVNPSL
jgi:hypothetical protein